jgi:hypothetical protein
VEPADNVSADAEVVETPMVDAFVDSIDNEAANSFSSSLYSPLACPLKK